MADIVEQAIKHLRAAGVRLDRGLSDTELARVEGDFHVAFGPEHRRLVQAVLPVGEPSWPDWRHGSAEGLQARVDWPIDGIVFDVHNNAFWPASWGTRPEDRADRDREARRRLAEVPRLAPVFSHRYLTAGPEYVPSPVFSVYQSDVIFYGDNLLDYIAHEFRTSPPHPSPDRVHVPFWSDLAEGADNADL